MSLDTTIEGQPGSIVAVADWLRGSYSRGTEDLASTAYRQRSRSGSAWEGAAGEAFRSRATTLAESADTAASEASAVAGELDALASAMARAQDGMARVRSNARSQGLTVRGNVIEPPGPPPPDVPALPADATPAEVAAYDRGVAAIEAHEALVQAWNQACQDAQGYFDDWGRALESAARTWDQHGGNLAGVGADFLSAGVSAAVVLRVAPILAGEARFQLDNAARLRGHAGAMVRDGRLTGPRAGYYDLLDRAAQADTRASEAARGARNVRVPSGIARGLGVLGLVATGYAVHEDIEKGESPAQAAVSNGAGLVAAIGASAAAGAGIGAVAGSFIPVPGVGTAIGVVGGAVVGTVVGTFTSGAVDSLWKSGADSLGDVGDAISDGWQEVANTGAAVGDLAEDAWDALF